MILTKAYIEENYLTKAGKLKPNINIDKSLIYLVFNNKKEPKCKYCDQIAKFVSFSGGYKDTCCSKECLSMQNKEKQKKAKRPNKELAIKKYSEKCLKSEYWEALDQYVSFIEPIKHRCRYCNETKYFTPKALSNSRDKLGPSCVKCAKKKYLEKEHNNYISELEERKIDIYPIEIIRGRDSKSPHKCTCGNEWDIKPYDVLRGIHCYECSGGLHTDRFYKNKKTILYYVKINNLWKIGITIYRESVIKSINRRFGANSVKLLFHRIYSDGAEAYFQEQNILEEYKKYKYLGEKIIKDGYTEVFRYDISSKILSVFLVE